FRVSSTANTSNREGQPYIFDVPLVRWLLIILYFAVFVTGLVGNVVELTVMYLHPRMRSTTNFFLTNLAVADLCVILFCVIQNLWLYLAQSWVFGNFLCKMYNFVHHLTYTASVMILMVTCVERYLAIMQPRAARAVLRHRNLLAALAIVWTLSGIYSCPRLIFFKAVKHELENNVVEVICLADRKLYDSRTFDTINFVLLYVIPLTVISIFYWKIGRYLWINGSMIEQRFRQELTEAPLTMPMTSRVSDRWSERRIFLQQQMEKEQHAYENRPLNVRMAGSSSSSGKYSFRSDRINRKRNVQPQNSMLRVGPYHSYELIRTWRKVIKLLVAFVLCFAICNLPFHLRKMLSYYYHGYQAVSNYALLATPITNLLTYLNSAMNPLLYSFMNHNFRSCVRDVIACRYTLRGKRRSSTTKGHHSKPLQLNSFK
ncbi:G protein-coupled receptor rhodopsin-like, partial [Trinorchestia longiramus]